MNTPRTYNTAHNKNMYTLWFNGCNNYSNRQGRIEAKKLLKQPTWPMKCI